MAAWTAAGTVLVLFLVVGVGLFSGKRVEDASDLVGGGKKAGPSLVYGTIMGNLVSGQATVRTARPAFHYGLVAWWFTLGAGVGCLILGVMYVRPLRDSDYIIELQIISGSYGATAGNLGSVLCSTGIFISVLAQVVVCSGPAAILFPHILVWAATLASIIIMYFYTIFGDA